MSGAAVDPAGFRLLMSRWPTGVAVVTSRDGERDHGLTVNAFLSVSLHPPAVLISLTSDADTTPVIERTRTFGVSLLAADQQALSERFAEAIPPERKFEGVAIRRGSLGPALLDGSVGALECRVSAIHPSEDHRLIIGEVVRAEVGPDVPPLLFHRRRYGAAPLSPP